MQELFYLKIPLSKCGNFTCNGLTNTNSKYGDTQRHSPFKITLERVAQEHHFYFTLSFKQKKNRRK